MQDSVEKSISDGLNRALGTIMGGAFGVAFAYFKIMSLNVYLGFLVCMFCVSLLIYMCVLINRKGMVAITCIVFLAVAVDPRISGEPVSYAIDRVVDTIIGIAIAVIVNRFFFSPEHSRLVSEKEGLPNFSYIFKRAAQMSVFAWEGGTFSEIYISPHGSLFSEKNFAWRLAVAEVLYGETRLKKAEGYRRVLMTLDSEMRLVHKGHYAVKLAPFESDNFDAGWRTNCFGKGKDLHLMLKAGFSGKLSAITGAETFKLAQNETSAFYSLCDGVKVSLLVYGREALSETLDSGDFICFDKLERGDYKIEASVEKDGVGDGALSAIRVEVYVEDCEGENAL
jgi:environmental stress-induced protein Ves